MKTRFCRSFTLALVLIVTSVVVTARAFAVTPITPKVSVENGFIFTPLAGSSATAGYGTLKNISNAKIEILGLRSGAFKAAELHETKEENGLMKMKKLAKLVLNPGETFELKPGGNHMMLFDATKSLKASDEVIVVLEIADAKGQPTIASPIDLVVKDRDAKATDAGGGHSHH